MRICQLFTCRLDVCDVIRELRSFVRFKGHAHLSYRLDVIAENKCVAYMFKLFRLVSKLSALDKYFVPAGRKDYSPEEGSELKSITHSILKRLKEKELSTLQRALETHGGLQTTCIFFPTYESLACSRQPLVEPQVVLYRVFRLPQVRSSTELKRIPCCSPHNGLDKKVCINPYHYSAIMNTGWFKDWNSKSCSKLSVCVRDFRIFFASNLHTRQCFLALSVHCICDFSRFSLHRASKYDLFGASEHYGVQKWWIFRYVRCKLCCWWRFVFVRFPDIESVCLTHRFSFWFSGFISNNTQSTICTLESRTSFIPPSSQPSG